MAGFRNSSDDQGPVAEINITPLVDVMLVLLVIFMVTAPLMENGIPVQLPKARANSLTKEDNPVNLILTKDGRIFVNRTEIEAGDLKTRLESVFNNRDNKEIFIRADGTLPYAFVAQTMATVKSAGIYKIGLVTLPPEAKGGK